jgi:hypothetical protein
MPKHTVKISIPTIEIGNVDFVIEVHQDSKKLGEVHASKGNIEWKPVNKTSSKYKLSWAAFAELMVLHGTSTKK